MFNLKDFILKGIKGMIGNEPDYRVIKYSAAWYDKGVLTDAELSEIDRLIAANNPPEEAAVETEEQQEPLIGEVSAEEGNGD